MSTLFGSNVLLFMRYIQSLSFDEKLRTLCSAMVALLRSLFGIKLVGRISAGFSLVWLPCIFTVATWESYGAVKGLGGTPNGRNPLPLAVTNTSNRLPEGKKRLSLFHTSQTGLPSSAITWNVLPGSLIIYSFSEPMLARRHNWVSPDVMLMVGLTSPLTVKL